MYFNHDKLKKLLSDKKLNLTGVAKDAGLNPVTLMKIRDGRVPTIDTFICICNALSLDPASFFESKTLSIKEPA